MKSFEQTAASFFLLCGNDHMHCILYKNRSVLKPDRLFLFQSMKRKQKSCQNEPSAGRFDGPRARFDQRPHQN